MPYKDPEKRREHTRLRVQRHRERKRAMMVGDNPPKPKPFYHPTTRPVVGEDVRIPAPVSHPIPEGDALIWIEENLKVPSGPLRGKPFVLGKWQKKFIKEAMKPGIREAGLCVARKNGKTGLVAAIVLAHLVGPWCRPDWRGLVASLNSELAIELRHAVTQTAELSGLPIELQKSPRPGAVVGLNNAYCQFLATDRGTGHAKGADLAIIDEAGLMQEAQRETWNAMLSSVSGRDGRLMVISILGDGPMMSELREREKEPEVCWHGFTTSLTDKPDSPKIWHKANPGLKDGIKSMKYMKDMSKRALANPADMAAFRAYDLNSPQAPDRIMLVTMEQYESSRKKPPPRAGECVVGVDLGGSASMTAAAAYWWETGRLEVKAALPGIPDLHTRQMGDGVGNRYQRMVDRGELQVYPGCRVTPVAPFLRDFLTDVGTPVAIVADRYRQSEAEDVYEQMGLRCTLVWRGMGWLDASADVRAFQRAVIDQRMRVGDNLLLESAIVESALEVDPAGNQKLNKARSKGRIDAASAAILAIGEAERIHNRPIRRTRYLGIV